MVRLIKLLSEDFYKKIIQKYENKNQPKNREKKYKTNKMVKQHQIKGLDAWSGWRRVTLKLTLISWAKISENFRELFSKLFQKSRLFMNKFSNYKLNFFEVTERRHDSTPAKCNYTTSPNIRATFRAIYETHLPGLVEKLKFRLPTFSPIAYFHFL